MQPKTLAFLLALALLALGATALAQTGGLYDLSWHTVDSGGGAVTGGNYALVSALGQPDAGTASGGSYALASGFLYEVAADPVTYRLALPFVVR